MKRVLFPGLLGLLLWACGGDETTSPGGETEITISVSPGRAIVDLNQQQLFRAYVFGTSQRDVIWYVEDIQGGDDTFGTIDSSGIYSAPSAEPDIDSIKVTAILQVDPAKYDDAWVFLSDPTKIYVDTSGSDTEGTGSKSNPYRTITHALTQWQEGQIIEVGLGTFDLEGGETFPIQVGTGVVIKGVDKDSTFVVGPGGSQSAPRKAAKIASSWSEHTERTPESSSIECPRFLTSKARRSRSRLPWERKSTPISSWVSTSRAERCACCSISSESSPVRNS